MRKPFKSALMLAAAGGVVAALVAPAAATATPNRSTAGTENYRLAAVGSDTIFCVDNAMTQKYNTAVSTTTGNRITNVAPIGGVNLGCKTTPLTTSVPADSFHGIVKFANPPVPPTPNAPPGNGNLCAAPLSSVAMPWEYPDGSSLGVTCYTDDEGAGNLAYTRSSRGRKSTDPASLEFWAFALDAVSWSSNYSGAPASLTPGQIAAIMSCTDTEWGQVNGNPSDTTPISVWYPQTGSGTGSFFAQVFLNNTYPTASSCLPQSHFVEENDGNAVNAAGAFYPYSYALHTAQTNGTEQNVTNGFTLGAVSGTAPTLTTIKEAAAKTNTTGDACSAPTTGTFCATRYVYHTAWQSEPAAEYAAAIDFMGVPSTGTAGANSICANKYPTLLKKYGFKPLPLATTAESTSSDPVPGKSYCRQY